jgi:hypothetical protein
LSLEMLAAEGQQLVRPTALVVARQIGLVPGVAAAAPVPKKCLSNQKRLSTMEESLLLVKFSAPWGSSFLVEVRISKMSNADRWDAVHADVLQFTAGVGAALA